MKLHHKLALLLMLAVVAIFSTSQYLDYRRSQAQLTQLAAANIELLQQREWQNSENVYRSVQEAVKGSLERGEMEKFARICQSQTNLTGLLEFSLYSKEGIVTHSSHPAFKGKTLPADLADTLLNRLSSAKRLTAEAFEIYHPQKVTGDCIRCHTTWKINSCGGVLGFRFSADALGRSQTDWAASREASRKASVRSGVATTIATVLIFSLVSGAAVRILVGGVLGRAIKQAVSKVGRSSEDVNKIALHLGATSKALADKACEQATSLEETSSSLDEMASMTRRNAESAGAGKSLANRARHTAENGAIEVQEMGVNLEHTKQLAEEMKNAVVDLKTSSNEAARIIRTIDEIAFQTNILALNAAVEAARAGHAGLGFGVVADEVRNLAQRSAKAARDTAQIIECSLAKTNHSEEANTRVVESLCSLEARVKGVQDNFSVILDTSRSVDKIVAEIASACDEQSRGICHINSAVAQMDKITQTTASDAEESANASDQLRQESGALTSALGELRQIVDGKKDIGDPALCEAGSSPGRAKMPATIYAANPSASSSRPARTVAVSPGPTDRRHDRKPMNKKSVLTAI